ncbi:outer membrane receptor protein [Brenneria goodwinii]|uniref:Outer membrane receptor protein n=1 Tax=Brenneria goodwinii TaxID=1109412 RepID=A0AAE8ESR1_9GAMM|nr:TonB-dependent siderophore receptor [Brenneria goodwinii]ATA25306.1 outer membrane receptor protein [Brenneria goodwinii]RLM28608.1 outer membrane receptor protein [Brenneria goodwinii]
MSVTSAYIKRPLAVLLAGILGSHAYAAEETQEDVMVVQATAEEALKQQPGVSIITKEDIEKEPPVNDLSDIIRKMPGVNLTGNSASGSRGNNRQIDIRGMGPENTLILIDGKPVTSRNAVRYSWRGERDTRGDTNWVPVEMVERIEVLRGPAAARYGSGAAGGVVNIITKRPTNDWHGSFSLYTNQPEDDKEGATKRANFSLNGPLIDDVLTMRLYGNINKTDADAFDINTQENGSYAAGREGVRNKDINTLLSWKINPQQMLDFEYGYSRQGNIYSGDTQYSNANLSTLVPTLYGAETNRMYRQNYGITHNGIWDWGQSRLGLYYEKTNNTRLKEGSTGRVEGMINSNEYATSRLENYKANGELNIPFHLGVEQTATLGAEWNREQLNDPASMTATSVPTVDVGDVSGDPSKRSTKNSAELSALYFEDNIEAAPGTNIIPGLRFDYHSKFGANWSPSLNASQELGEYFKLKAGIARVFKAPNLYQSSMGYLLRTNGNGCPSNILNGACYLLGNDDLDPEVSVNKEIGLSFSNNGYDAGITYFRNDYKNKIVAGTEIIGTVSSDNNANILQWENGGKALVEGLEANLTVPLVRDTLDWRTNATYMITSEFKDTGNPLSVIPKYTINTMLDWQVTEKLSTNVAWTMYGRQKPREYPDIRNENGSLSTNVIGAYSVVGVGLNYDVIKNVRINAGISNLLDKRVYRENEGASTYNEPGRAYYAGVTYNF